MSSEDSVLLVDPPDSESAIRKAVEAEQRRHQAWFEQQSKRMEKLRDRNLKQLDSVADGFRKGFSAGAQSEGNDRLRQRRKRATKCTAAQYEERLKGIYRFLLQKGKPMSCPEIGRPLNLTRSQAYRALSRLVADGMVRRSGIGSDLKYEAKPGKQNRMEQANRVAVNAEIPVGIRTLEAIRAKGEVTPDELARELRVPFEHVQRSCLELIREDQIAVDTSGGRRVYTALKAA